jgi:hypothetical protein
MTDCLFGRNENGLWQCGVCEYVHPRRTPAPPRRRCNRKIQDVNFFGPPIERKIQDAAETGARELGIVAKGAHYIKALARWTWEGWPRRTDEEVAAIVAICKGCDDFNREAEACKVCGCKVNTEGMAIRNKARMKTEVCPKGKWE